MTNSTAELTKLSNANLGNLSSNVATPSYDRSKLSAGIVHIGVGNFHRAHMALYLDDLFNVGQDQDWAIIGAGVRPEDAQMRQELSDQDYLTTLVELEPGNNVARVIGPMIDFLEVAPDNGPLIQALAMEQIRIVSLTVTEGGYYINPALGHFDPEHPDIVHDIQSPRSPKTAFGAIIRALDIRRQHGRGPFTIMSCDNLPENGDVAKDTILGLAKAQDPELAAWISQHVSFPNSMVDRITPATSDTERDLVRESYGIVDQRPVTSEPFRQWVLEDNFCAGRPAFEKVGVTVTDDVIPFETMKIRILNGGHAAMAYPSALLDIHYVHDAAADPLISTFLEKLERAEIVPIVPPVPDTDLNQYLEDVLGRLLNPGVRDTIPRLCLDGSNRQPKFIIPTVNDRLEAGDSVSGLALVSALWCRYCFGTTDSGAITPPNDPNWDRLQATAKEAKDRPLAWLEMDDIYGTLAQDSTFAPAFVSALNDLWANGTRKTLEAYIG